MEYEIGNNVIEVEEIHFAFIRRRRNFLIFKVRPADSVEAV